MCRKIHLKSCVFIWCLVQFVFVSGQATPEFNKFYFTAEPTDVVAYNGRPATLQCGAHSDRRPAPTIQWTRDNVYIQFFGGSRKQLLSNGSLSFSYVRHTHTDRPDAGEYRCVATVTGLGTIVSRAAHLRVGYFHKQFDVVPQSLVVHQGDLAMFNCELDSLPPAVIKWYKGNQELTGDNVLIHPDGVLEIRGVRRTDFGRYKCQAVHPVIKGDAVHTSASALLSKSQLPSTGVSPSFVMRPQGVTASEGGSVLLHCGANGRNLQGIRPTITWLKDGHTLNTTSTKYSIEGSSSLRIHSLQEVDDGSYTCRASNNEDSKDAVAIVIVQVPPRILVHPQSMFAYKNRDMQFNCDIYGKPTPKIKWRKNGDIITPSDYFQIIKGTNLKILGVVDSDDGLYQCFGENPAGSVQAGAQLIVLKENVPIPTTPSPLTTTLAIDHVTKNAHDLPSAPRNLRAAIKSTRFVSLTWTSASSEGPTAASGYSVTWREDGEQRERTQNTTATEAQVQQLKPNTRYVFRVRAYNNVGYSPHTTLTVRTQSEAAVPSVPRSFKCYTQSPYDIKVTWTAPNRTNGRISHYKVYFFKQDDPRENSQSTHGLTYTLRNLEKFSPYTFRVEAYNSKGQGESSADLTCRTYSDVPQGVPTNVTLEPTSSSSITIRWDPPLQDRQPGLVTGYKIKYRVRGSPAKAVVTDADTRMHVLTSLLRATEYQVKIQALSINGSGPVTRWSTQSTFSSDLDESQVPGKPTSLKARGMPTEIVISWTPPRNRNIRIRGYKITYGEGVPEKYTHTVDSKINLFRITNLKPSTQYVIGVNAFNRHGHGQPALESEFTRQETTPKPPTPMLPPVGLQATVLSAKTVVLTWIDTTIGGNQRYSDNRYYTIKYRPLPPSTQGRKWKYLNSTDLNKHIDHLTPHTQYEFNVKVIKGRRRSTWSMTVINRTFEAVPSDAPRDLTPVAIPGKIGPGGHPSTTVVLNWQPPVNPNGQINGYLVFYTTDPTQLERNWVVEGVLGDKLTASIKGLTPDTTYYFKVQARNGKGYGPKSATEIYRTPGADGTGGGPIETPDDIGVLPSRPKQTHRGKKGKQDGSYELPQETSGDPDKPSGSNGGNNGISKDTLWIIIGSITGVFIIVCFIAVGLICHRRMNSNGISKNRKGYKPANVGKGSTLKDIKPPPDLWIHHDMEMKNISNQSSPDTTPSPVSRSHENIDDLPPPMTLTDNPYVLHHPDSLRFNRQVKPKPVMIPMDPNPVPPREPIVNAVPIGGHIEALPPQTRPSYPRTQYSMIPPRVHAGDVSHPASGPRTPTSPDVSFSSLIDSSASSNDQLYKQTHSPPVYPGGSTGQLPDNSKSRPSHPLKSFSVPAPPVAPSGGPLHSTPPKQGIVKPQQPPSSPYRKTAPVNLSQGLTTPVKCRSPMPVLTPRAPDVLNGSMDNLQKATSTEELNAEMVNLEGIMKDLNAITQSEFDC